MRDILITHSYFLHFDPKEYRAMMPYPPLGTLYAASMLRKDGFDVSFHDTMLAHNEEEIRDSLQTHQPKIIVIYDDQFNYLTKMCLSRMRQAAFKMADIAKEQGCIVIVFSSDATDHLEEYFRHNIDFILCGEAELTLCELADALLRNPERRVDSIHGIAYKEDGTIRQTNRRELMTKLDEIPFPAWDLVDIERYRSAWKRRHGYYSVNVVTTRGCPFHCNWCAKPIYGQVYHSRSPENVVEELIYLKKTINPDHIWFVDDIFGLRPGWLSDFDGAINKHNVKIPFKCLSRADLLLKEDNIRHLKNSSCQTVWIGAESGSQKVLDAMEKGTTIEQIYQSTELLRRSRIRVGFFLQFGYPGETKSDIQKTIHMVKNCNPDEIGISVSYPLPGTRFYESVKSQLGEKRNWVDSQDLDLMFAGEYHPDFYRTLHRVVHKKFSVWRGMRTAKEILQQPTRFGKKSLRSMASMFYHGATLPLQLYKLSKLEHLPASYVGHP